MSALKTALPVIRRQTAAAGGLALAEGKWPSLIVRAGAAAQERFLEFFVATIRNKNTREAYFRAISRFLKWADERHLELEDIRPIHVASYIEGFTVGLADPSVKQHLAAIKMFFGWMVTGQIVPFNPASSVRGPKHVVQRRAKAAGLMGHICNHSFRATGITVYLENGGALETAAHIAAHESPRTTKLYDRTADNITLEEIERIRF